MSLPQKELLRDSSPHSLKQVFHLLPSLYLSPGVRIYSCICLLDCCWFPHCIPRSTGVLEEHWLDDLMNKGTPSNELHCNEEKKGSLSKLNIQVSKIPLSIPIEEKRIQIIALGPFQARFCSCLRLSLSPSVPNSSENGQIFSFNTDFICHK